MMVVVHAFIVLQSIVALMLAPPVVVSIGNLTKTSGDRNPDVYLTTPELLNIHGYPSEIHHAVTEDGYILEMHRIISVPVNGSYRKPWMGAVLMQHGFGGSSADWVLMGPQKSLAFLLADHGYDVWLGNSRGNVYSRNHTSLSPSDRAFWDFSWHEMGVFDLPAVIDYILNRTQREKIFYVGHSQGTAEFWVLSSERPDYNAKIILMAALAPVSFSANLQGPITKLNPLAPLLVRIGESLGYPEFGPKSDWAIFVANIICRDAPAAVMHFSCNSLVFAMAGFNPEEMSTHDLHVINGHVPAGASWKQLLHFGQGSSEQGRFRQFDYYNDEKNLRLYNSTLPPQYPLENIRAPVAIFSSDDDWLANTKDVAILESKLQTLIFNYKVPDDTFNHYDFLWGKRAPELVYDTLFKLLEEYST